MARRPKRPRRFLYAFACGTTKKTHARALTEAVEDLLVAEDAVGAVPFGGHVLTYKDGSQWFAADASDRDHSALVQRLARAVGLRLTLVRVSLNLLALDALDTDEYDTAAGLPAGMGDAQWFSVGKDGVVGAKKAPAREKPWKLSIEEHETVQAALWARFRGGRDDEVSRDLVSGFIAPEESDLSPRLADLRNDILRAGRYELTDVAGQRMVRVTLDAGERRLSAVSEEELKQLEEATGIAHSE